MTGCGLDPSKGVKAYDSVMLPDLVRLEEGKKALVMMRHMVDDDLNPN